MQFLASIGAGVEGCGEGGLLESGMLLGNRTRGSTGHISTPINCKFTRKITFRNTLIEKLNFSKNAIFVGCGVNHETVTLQKTYIKGTVLSM